MDEEVKKAIQDLCDQVKSWADSRRNISMQDFKNNPLMTKLRSLIGEVVYLD